jgi:hypothetical protein
MTYADWAMLIAVLLGPILAVRVSEIIAGIREDRDRKIGIFKTLMSTRATNLAPRHVEALNMIDVEFDKNKRKDKAVIAAWRTYLNCLNESTAHATDIWLKNRRDALVELLYQMGVRLGYDFEKHEIDKNSYFPVGHGEIENDNHIIRKGLAAILSGQASIPMEITGVPPRQPNPSPNPAEIPLTPTPATPPK